MANISYGFVQPTAETGVPAAVADGDPVEPWFDEYGRKIDYADDVSTGTKLISEPAPALTARMIITNTQLTAVGDTPAQNISLYHHHVWHYTIANIDTSVTVNIASSLDNTNFVSYASVTQTANGTFEFEYDAVDWVYTKFQFSAEVGGANATIDVVEYHGN